MKHLIRYLSVLLCVLLLSAVFSIGASASSVVTPYCVTIRPYHTINGVTENLDTYQTFDLDYFDTTTFTLSLSGISNPNLYKLTYGNSIYISKKDGSLLFKKGVPTDFQITDFFFYCNIDGSPRYNIDDSRILLEYTDGTFEYLNGYELISNNNKHDISVSFTPNKNVKKLEINVWQRRNPSANYSFIYKFGFFEGATYGIDITEQSEESGLLSGILGWIENIFNSVKNGFNSVVEGFSNIGTWFAELPGKLWVAISDGLKSLFVPTEESIQSYKDKWEHLLSERFGALYQSFDIIIDFLSSLSFDNNRTVLYIPSVDLYDYGIPFSFGGFEVDIFDNYLINQFLILVRSFTTFCMLVLFLNGLRKKYDSVFGG